MTVALTIVVFLFVNAVFVAAEFAALGTRESRVRRAAESGSGSARLLLPFLLSAAKLDRYISACQLGNTISSLGLGAYCQFALMGGLAAMLEATIGMQPAQALTVAASRLSTFVRLLSASPVPRDRSPACITVANTKTDNSDNR